MAKLKYFLGLAILLGTLGCASKQVASPIIPDPPTIDPNAKHGLGITWKESVTVDNFKVYRGSNCNVLNFYVSSVNKSYLDSNVVRGHTYCYAISAVRQNKESAKSSTSLVTVK